ncbi:unnamed protein product, partial [Phaeothamnion confervicola]
KDVCPPSKTNDDLTELIKRLGNDDAKITSAIAEWWEQEDSGGRRAEEWVTTSKKDKKK